MKPAAAAIEALIAGRHADPFSLLGAFEGPGGWFARALVPGAETVETFALDDAPAGALEHHGSMCTDHPLGE